MMPIINKIASLVTKKRIKTIERMIQAPMEHQEQVLKFILKKTQNTLFAKDHNLSPKDNIESFRRKVPIRKYEDFYPYIHKSLLGEPNIIWQGRIKWFAKSSGTTNDKSKFIPIPKESLYLNHYEAGKDMIAVYIHNNPSTKIFSGKVLSIGGSHEISKFNKYARYGDLSAVLIENMPPFYEFFRAPSKKIALMAEWEQKIQAMAQETIKENITGIAGVPTWTLVLINKLFEIAQNKPKNLLDIWNNLEVFFHGAVSFTPYRKQFQELCPSPNMHYMEIYNASEGYFAFEHQFNRHDMLLLLHRGIFYEFLPVEDLHKENPKTYLINEVEINRNYALVITTVGGLQRYLIGDTVKFTEKNPYTIVITGRTKHFLNAFGEEVVIENVEQAVAKACEQTGASIEDFTVAPIFFEGTNAGRHEWIIEFSKKPQNLQEFVNIIDSTLKQLNSDYEAKRYKNIALKPPLFKIVPRGTFYKWMKLRGKLGGQNKVPRLSNDRKYVDSILEMLKQDGIPVEQIEANY